MAASSASLRAVSSLAQSDRDGALGDDCNEAEDVASSGGAGDDVDGAGSGTGGGEGGGEDCGAGGGVVGGAGAVGRRM